ncbi:MAG TPA: O-antigen ligase family protein [Syntrophorhabdaceae bacterium]|nr:O-antigen ligase family protein [Syntrophorhabdaceae bacterium]
MFYVTIDKFWIETTFILFVLFSIFTEYRKKRERAYFEENDKNSGDFFIFFIPFFLLNALSIIWSWNTLSTLNELNVLVWSLAAVYLFSISDRKETALKAIVLGGAVLGICAIVQSKVLFPKLIEVYKGRRYAEIVSTQPIPFASFLYHNIFGGYMSFILPLALYFGIYKKKALFEIATVFILAATILSTSRIAMGISSLFLMGLIFFLIKEKKIKSALHLLATIVIAITLVFILLKAGREGEAGGLTNELGKKAQITKSEIKTLNTRTEIWKNAFRAFIAHPLTGVGSGATEFGYRKYFNGGIYTRYTHSLPLKILVELGLMGLASFLIYLVGYFYFSKERLNDYQYRFIFSSVLCGIVFGLLDFSFDMPAHTITFFVLSSMAFTGKNELKNRQVKPERLTIIHSFLKNIPVILITIIVLASFMFTAKVCLARKSIEIANVLEENGFIEDAYHMHNEAIKEMPLDNEGYIKSVSILKRLYEIEPDAKKKKILKDALLLMLNKMERIKDTDSQVYFTLGLCYETLEKEKEAEYYLLKAITYYPSSAYYMSELIRFYLVRGEIERANMWVQAAKPYFDIYRSSKNPVGFFVCKIIDMEAEIEFIKGNKIKALSISTDNLLDVINDKYIISNVKTGLIIPKDRLVAYLKHRVDRFK